MPPRSPLKAFRRRAGLALRHPPEKVRCSGRKWFTIMFRLSLKYINPNLPAPLDPMSKSPDPKPFEGAERRRNPEMRADAADSGEVTVFHELGKALTSSLQLDQVLRTIMEKINEVLRPDTWSLLLMDIEKQELYFQIATGKGAEALKDVRIKVGQGLAGWVAQTGEVVVVPDTTTDSRFFSQVDEKTKMATRSIVAVPVRFREQCLGVIELINCVGTEGFSRRDLALLEALADYAAIAIENARHVQRIHELTITDDCTSLYNARHLNFMLDTEIYRSHRYAFEFSSDFYRSRPLQDDQRHARPLDGLESAFRDRRSHQGKMPLD